MVRISIQIVGALLIATAAPARADEQMIPLAMSGTWMAVAHKASLVAPPDICVVTDVATGFVLWTNGEEVQLRFVDQKWSLPSYVVGQITVSIADWTAAFDITNNSGTMVIALLDENQRSALLQNMNKGRSMSIKIGKAAPVRVSLEGSRKVTNAWRTCAGLEGGDGTTESNPFK